MHDHESHGQGHEDQGHSHGDGAHGHAHGYVDASIATSDRGIWAIKWSFIGLFVTAILQIIVFYFSRSVGLLADTIHNFGDATTAIPLGIAFLFARLKPTKRFPFGYGRVEEPMRWPIQRARTSVTSSTPETWRAAWAISSTTLGSTPSKARVSTAFTESHAEVNITVMPQLTVAQAHAIAAEVHRELMRKLQFLERSVIHTDPVGESGEDHHLGEHHDHPHNPHSHEALTPPHERDL
jgi:divalent metal cation (Fe/Co/Zn/Cd) transporter